MVSELRIVKSNRPMYILLVLLGGVVLYFLYGKSYPSEQSAEKILGNPAEMTALKNEFISIANATFERDLRLKQIDKYDEISLGQVTATFEKRYSTKENYIISFTVSVTTYRGPDIGGRRVDTIKRTETFTRRFNQSKKKWE